MANKDQRKSIKRNELHSNRGYILFHSMGAFGIYFLAFSIVKDDMPFEVGTSTQGNWFTRRIMFWDEIYIVYIWYRDEIFRGHWDFLWPGLLVRKWLRLLRICILFHINRVSCLLLKMLERWWTLAHEEQVDGTPISFFYGCWNCLSSISKPFYLSCVFWCWWLNILNVKFIEKKEVRIRIMFKFLVHTQLYLVLRFETVLSAVVFFLQIAWYLIEFRWSI